MTHILGEHTELVITTATDCRANTHTPDQARNLLEAALQCIDLVGGITQAARPRAASPSQPAFANRTRDNDHQAAPMNPVSRHYGTGASRQPPNDSDSAFWRHQYNQAPSHFDRCDVVRRAGRYLAGLIRRDPNAPTGNWTETDLQTDVIVEGHGWPLTDVARRFKLTATTVANWRIDDGRHPLTGRTWTPPEHKAFQAVAAREMRDAGLTSTTIACALNCSASAVRMWTTKQRRAA